MYVFDAMPIGMVTHICDYKFGIKVEEVKNVLRFLHDVGLALFYEKLIPNWIFLNPAFITRRIANIIKEGHEGQKTQRKRSIKSDLDSLWAHLYQNGFLDMKLLNFLWSDGHIDHVPKAVIVQLLCHFGVLVDVSNGVGGDKLLEPSSFVHGGSEATKVALSEIVPTMHRDSFLQKFDELAKGPCTVRSKPYSVYDRCAHV